MSPLATLYVVEMLKEDATHANIEQKVGKNYATVHRHFRTLRECLGIIIRSESYTLNKNGERYYRVDDWGVIDRENFMELFQKKWYSLLK